MNTLPGEKRGDEDSKRAVGIEKFMPELREGRAPSLEALDPVKVQIEARGLVNGSEPVVPPGIPWIHIIPHDRPATWN